MKKKILISVLLCIAVLSAGLTGCMKKDDEVAPTESPLVTLQKQVATLEGWQGGVNTQLADKPTRAEMDAAITAGVAIPDLTALEARIATLETDAGTLKTDVATLEAENAALEARLDGLVEEGAVTPTPTGELTLTVAQGPDQVYAGTDYIYFLQLTNDTGDFKKVYILATASPTGGLVGTYTVNTGVTEFRSNSAYFTLPTGVTEVFEAPSFSPTDGVNCRIISATTAGYILTSGTASVQIPITFSLRYADGAVMWNVSFTPIVTSY